MSEHRLHIGLKFSLPLELVTSTQAILARKRSGKSYAASVMAEELLSAGQQIAVIDPTGAWYGLKSSSDGKSAGFPIVVFGGEHADVPLEPGAGEMLAKVLVEQRFSAVFDLSLMGIAEGIRFVAAFTKALFFANRAAMHLFIDEADAYCPQKPFGEEAMSLSAVKKLVKQGGIRGIGVTMITQRPAVLNKDVLSQVDILTVLRMSHPLDIKAAVDWISSEVSVEFASQVKAELPSLPVGTAFLCSAPLNIGQRVEIRLRKTFNSGATPKAGEARAQPKVLAQVDIDRLGQQIAQTIARAKEDDPKELKRQIAELKRKAPSPVIEPDRSQLDRLEQNLRELEQMEKNLQREYAALSTAYQNATRVVVDLGQEMTKQTILPAKGPLPKQLTAPVVAKPAPKKAVFGWDGKDTHKGELPVGEQKILIVLAQYQAGLRREQISIFSGYTAKSTRDAYIQRLTQKGYVQVEGSLVKITDDGLRTVGSYEPLPRGEQLQSWWIDQLPLGEAAILTTLCTAYPQALTREEIGRRTGYTAKSTRDAYIQRLRQRMLVDTSNGTIQASKDLFD